MRTITKHVRVTLSLMCAVLLLSTTFAACSDSNDPKEPNNPDAPVNTGDDMTVPASGGTITKGDISITFPSGTFDSDTKVTITEVKKGTAIGRCEASPFYQLTLPLKTSKPFTVRMKSNYTDGEAEFVLLTAGYSISYDRDLTNETVLETTYSNGEYTATMPIIEGNDSKENGSVIIGLGRLPDDIIAASRTVTRGIGSVIGLDGNVKWNLSINYGYIDKYSQNYKKLDDALVDVNMHIKEAIKTIHGLGIKMPDGVTINYRLCALKDAYGEYSASKICRSEDCIYLHDGMVLKGQTNLLKQTIIHETLHNYQTYYLPYYYLPLRMAALKNDQRSMYEIGAIWIEKYANGGKINGDWQLWESGLCKTFNNHFRIGLSQSSNDVKALFEDYDLQGYAQAPLLYHMIKRNNSTVVGDTVVANLYGKFMAKISEEGYTLIDVLNEWYYDNYKDHFFDGTDNINNYYLSLWKGELMNDFNFSMFELYMLAEEMPFDYMNEKKSKLSLDGKVYPYGCEGLIFKMDRTCFKDSLLNNDEMVIKQEAEGVKTYLLYSNGSKIIQYPKVAVLGDSICIPGAELEALRPKGVFNNYFFLLTVRENSSLIDKGSIPSKESVEIREINATVTPTEMAFFSDGGTLEAKVTAPGFSHFGVRVDNDYSSWLSAMPAKGGKIMVTAKANTTTEERTGYVKCYVAKSAGSPETEWVWLSSPIKVTQEAGEGDVTTYHVDVYFTCKVKADYITTTTYGDGSPTVSKGVWFYDDYSFTGETDVEISGSTLHITVSESKSGSEKSLSFDIQNLSGDYKQSVVNNIKYDMTYHTDEDNYSSDAIEIANLPLDDAYKNEYQPGGWVRFVAQGESVQFSDFRHYKAWTLTDGFFGPVIGHRTNEATTYRSDSENYAVLSCSLQPKYSSASAPRRASRKNAPSVTPHHNTAMMPLRH